MSGNNRNTEGHATRPEGFEVRDSAGRMGRHAVRMEALGAGGAPEESGPGNSTTFRVTEGNSLVDRLARAARMLIGGAREVAASITATETGNDSPPQYISTLSATTPLNETFQLQAHSDGQVSLVVLGPNGEVRSSQNVTNSAARVGITAAEIEELRSKVSAHHGVDGDEPTAIARMIQQARNAAGLH